jgi:hypothetical protein
MEAPAPHIAAVAYLEVFAPYVAVLEAEGFVLEKRTLRKILRVCTTWEPVPQLYYFCDLVVVEGAIHVWLVRKPHKEPPFPLFHWMRIETPEELRWLLQRSVHLGNARANPVGESGNPALALANFSARLAPWEVVEQPPANPLAHPAELASD